MGEGTFGSFKELRIAAERQAEAERAAKFDRAFGQHFDDAGRGRFLTGNDQIESVSLVQTPDPQRPDRVANWSATMWYRTPSGQERPFSFSIGRDGTFSGDVPKDAPLAREDVIDLILNTAERIDQHFWMGLEGPIVGGHDQDNKDEPLPLEVERQPGGREQDRSVDPARLAFLESQPDALFGFFSKEVGFDGYHVAAFPNCLVIEHPRRANAVYILPLPDRVTYPAETMARTPSDRLTKAERLAFLEQHWYPTRDNTKTRGQLLELGATRVTHHGDWMTKLSKAIAEAGPER